MRKLILVSLLMIGSADFAFSAQFPTGQFKCITVGAAGSQVTIAATVSAAIVANVETPYMEVTLSDTQTLYKTTRGFGATTIGNTGISTLELPGDTRLTFNQDNTLKHIYAFAGWSCSN